MGFDPAVIGGDSTTVIVGSYFPGAEESSGFRNIAIGHNKTVVSEMSTKPAEENFKLVLGPDTNLDELNGIAGVSCSLEQRGITEETLRFRITLEIDGSVVRSGQVEITDKFFETFRALGKTVTAEKTVEPTGLDRSGHIRWAPNIDTERWKIVITDPGFDD